MWLNRFAWFAAFATLLLICSGGMVTSKGVGLAVPDWPTTFGYNMFLFPVSKWIGGVLFEHTHRLIASTVGFLTIILALWLWRVEDRPAVKTLGLIAVAGVILQGILGGLRVTMLKDQIGIFHACLAQAFLGLIVLIAIVTTDFWRTLNQNSTVLNGQVHQRFRRVKQFAIVATTLIYVIWRSSIFRPRMAHGFRIRARPHSQKSIPGATHALFRMWMRFKSGCKWRIAFSQC